MNVIQLKPQPATFEDWWARQEHKTGKLICKQKWDAIISEAGYHTKVLDKSTGEYIDVHLKATPEEIIAGQSRQNEEFYRINGYGNSEAKKYLRRPQQWLNQGGWMDG